MERESSFNCAESEDPGAARLGNFINYYQFNPPSERLSLLFPKKMFSQLEISTTGGDFLTCLDIGCNSGNISVVKVMNPVNSSYRPILDALHVGDDTAVVEAIAGLGTNFDPNAVPYRSGDSIVHLLARLGRTSILKLLIEKFDYRLNLEPTNIEGKRPLHEAAQFGRYDIVEILLKRGTQVDPIKRADWTPLMLAVTKPGVDAQKVVSHLLTQGHADATLKNKDGWNAFHLAAREGDVNILSLIFNSSPQSCQTVSKNGRTPAHTAALHGKLETLQFLSEKCNYSFNETDSCGATPLFEAARAGHLNVVSYLINSAGSSPTILDKMGRTCLSVAAHSGMKEVVVFLVENIGMGINIMSGDELKMAPIHWAAKEGHLETVRCLVDLKADANLKDTKGRTALAIALQGNHLGELTRKLHYELLREMKVTVPNAPTTSQNLNSETLKECYTKGNVHLLAIDVDDNLIEIAKSKMEKDEGSVYTKENISFLALDVMKLNEVDNAFKAYLQKLNKERFDIMFCFSVTMWIHLNHGDQGLKQFFQSAKKWCNYLILEPQPWRCYRTASRRMRKAKKPDFAYLEGIESKCEELYPFIVEECENIGFENIANFGETGWKRQIMLFKSCDAHRIKLNHISGGGDSITTEIAKTRQYITNSLECVGNLSAIPLHKQELFQIKISRLEVESSNLKEAIHNLRNVLAKLENRVSQLERGGAGGKYQQQRQ